MMIESTSITMFESFYLAGQDMSIEDRVKFYEAIMEYGFYGKEPELEGVINTVFKAIRPVLDRSKDARVNGRKGGRPRKTENDEKMVKTTLLTTLETERKGKERIGKDTDTEKDTEKEKKRKGESSRFAPPTLDDVTAYCTERGNGIDPQRFIDYYQSNGWKVGKNPMKDWKAAVRTWEQRDAAPKKADNLAEIREYYDQMCGLYPMAKKKDEGWDYFQKLVKGDPATARRIVDCMDAVVNAYYNGERCLDNFTKDIEVAYGYLRS